MVQQCLLFGFLAICSVEDIKRKQLKLWVILTFGIVGMIIHLLTFQTSIMEIAGGILIGLIVMLISILTKESIGMGDALLLMVTGMYLGAKQNILMLFIGIFLSGLFALVLMFTRKKQRKDEMPFVPFLFAGYLFQLFLEYGGI